jgi:hypothetical protein
MKAGCSIRFTSSGLKPKGTLANFVGQRTCVQIVRDLFDDISLVYSITYLYMYFPFYPILQVAYRADRH